MQILRREIIYVRHQDRDGERRRKAFHPMAILQMALAARAHRLEEKSQELLPGLHVGAVAEELKPPSAIFSHHRQGVGSELDQSGSQMSAL